MKKLIFTNLAMLLGCFGASSSWGQYPGAYGSLGPSSYPMQPQNLAASLPQVPQSYAGQNYPGQVQPMQSQVMQPTQSPGWLGQRNGSFQLVATQDQIHQQAGQPYTNNAVPGPHQGIHQVPQPAPQYGQSILTPTPMPDPMTSGQAYVDPNAQAGLPMVGSNCNQPLTYQSAPSYQTAPAPQAVMNPVYGQTVAPGCTSCGSAPIAESYGYPMHGGGHFGGRMAGFGQSMLCGMPDGAKPYFGGFNALIFRRVDDADRQLTYNVNSPDGNFLGTRDARFGTMGGFEGFAGRYFNCGRNAISLGYWGLYPDDESAMVTTNGGADLRSRYHFNGVEMPAIGAYAPDTVYNWYDDAVEHRIVRTSDYQNVEANLMGFMTGGAARSFYLPTSGTLFSGTRGLGGGCGYCGGSGCGMCGGGASCGSSCGTGSCGGGYANYAGNCGNSCAPACAPSCAPTRFATGPCCLTPGCGSRLNMTWLAGVRYFRFRDTLSYQASRADNLFNRANDDIYYDTGVKNDLVGVQIGGILNYCTGRRASLYMLTKMGVYGNHAQYDASLYGRAPAFINSANGYNGNNWMVSASKTDVAFIGELGSGVWYRLTPKWSANVGYKAIVASGVATAVDQIPLQMVHLGNVADFDNNGSLILHGVTLGGVYNY